MPRGRPTRLTIRLTPDDRQTLEAWQRSLTMPQGHARRGRIILLVEQGARIGEIAHAVGLSRRHVYKWVARFQAQGCEGLADRPRGRPGNTPGTEAERV